MHQRSNKIWVFQIRKELLEWLLQNCKLWLGCTVCCLYHWPISPSLIMAVCSLESLQSHPSVVCKAERNLSLFLCRYCRNLFDRDYKATIGVDFEVERFMVLDQEFNMQMWADHWILHIKPVKTVPTG